MPCNRALPFTNYLAFQIVIIALRFNLVAIETPTDYMEIDYEVIDMMLSELAANENVQQTYTPGLYQKFVNNDRNDQRFYSYHTELLSLELATEVSNLSLIITHHGRNVHRYGGYRKWKADQDAEIQREKDLREKEVHATVSSAESAKSAKVAAWVAGFISLGALVLSGWQYYSAQNTSTDLNAQIIKQDSLIKSLQNEVKMLSIHKKDSTQKKSIK